MTLDQIKSLIASGQKDRALSELQTYISKYPSLESLYIAIRTQDSELKSDSIMGILSFEEKNRKNNEITNSLLKLIGQVEGMDRGSLNRESTDGEKSRKANFDIANEKNPPFKARKNHLLVIGIDEYQHCGQLNNAVKDAKALIQVLTSHYKFETEDVHTLFDGEATQENIDMKMRAIASAITEDDNLLIYFSGHGEFDKQFGEGYWVPVEGQYKKYNTYISFKSLMTYLTGIKSHHTAIIADSCYSGAVLVREMNPNLERFDHTPSRWILASGRNEVVPDGKKAENSPFAEQLLFFLEQARDIGIRMGTLVEKVKTAVVYNSAQTPIGMPLRDVGDRGGEFVLYPKGYEYKK